MYKRQASGHVTDIITLQVKEEGEVEDPEERLVAKVGKLDAKKNIDKTVQSLMAKNILQCMGTMLDSVVF